MDVSEMYVTVSSKGQIVLPAEMRKTHNIKTGDRLNVIDAGGAIYLVPSLGDAVEQGLGLFSDAEAFSTHALLDERRADKERDA